MEATCRTEKIDEKCIQNFIPKTPKKYKNGQNYMLMEG